MKFQFLKYNDSSVLIKRTYKEGSKELICAHYHTAIELLFIERGELSVFTNGSLVTCSSGDMLLIPSGSIHHAASENEKTLIKAIMFDPSLTAASVVVIEKLLSKDFSKPFKIECDEKAINSFTNLYNLSENTVFSVADVTEILSELYAILARFIRTYREDSSSATTSRMAKVIEYIKENYRRPIYIGELSALIHVCDDHLIRLFKESTNKTPSRYISDLRIEQAMRLLADTKLSVSEISEQVGFSSPNYMIKVFLDRIGISPTKYRKRHSI